MIQVDSDFTYLVKLGFDKTMTIKDIHSMPKRELVIHEFHCKKSFNEYMNLLKDVNKDKCGTFHWECWRRPISKSKIYTKHKLISKT